MDTTDLALIISAMALGIAIAKLIHNSIELFKYRNYDCYK